MKVFLDDIRDPPGQGWIVARSYEDCIALLNTGRVTELSLDHDLGMETLGRMESGLLVATERVAATGYDVVKWIEARVAQGSFEPPDMKVHSANPVGAANMQRGIDAIRRMVNDRA